ncbi:MAG: helix-turn-helix domain-containing protein [Gammaproteobacteria bacterium]
MRANIIDFPKAGGDCEQCPWARTCVAHGLGEVAEESQAARCSAPLKRNQHVFRQGDEFEYLYVLRSGSAKSYFDSSDGLEQIVAFHYPGDLLGFDGLADGHYQTSVMALETAALCRVPIAMGQAGLTTRLLGDVMRVAARQTAAQHNHVLLLGQKSAAARFASLLLDLSERFAARGCSRSDFNLSMPRQDIANYLSLAVETVSRLFGELQAAGAIVVERRHVRIQSFDALQAIAADAGAGSSRASGG